MAQAVSSYGNEIHDANIAEQNLPPLPETNLAQKFYRKHYAPGFGKKVIAEVIATYLLVFMTCGTAAISGKDLNSISRLGASLAGGLIVTVMIYAVGHISGAHMNPAVTVAFASALRFPWKQVPLYWAAQLTGATVASFVLKAILHPLGITNIGATTPSGSALQSLVTEIVVTFNMMFVTAAVATDAKAVGELAGIAVGSAVCITSILAGPVSGGSMNPARTIGPALASKRFDDLWVYILGPVCGTLLGAWSYRLIREPGRANFSTGSNSLKLRRQKTDVGQTAEKDPLEDVY